MRSSVLRLVDLRVPLLLYSAIHRGRDVLPINRSKTWNTAYISTSIQQSLTIRCVVTKISLSKGSIRNRCHRVGRDRCRLENFTSLIKVSHQGRKRERP